MPSGQRSVIEAQLKQLPKSYTTTEIAALYRNLRADVDLMTSRGVPARLMEQRLHNTHKTLAFAYPSLFFKVVKGEMSEFMFTRVMEVKQDMDSGKITPSEAQDLILASAKEHVEGAAPRPARPDKDDTGATVQEIVIKTQVDENADMRVVGSEVVN